MSKVMQSTYAQDEAVNVSHRANVGRTLRHFLFRGEILARDIKFTEERQPNRDGVLHA